MTTPVAGLLADLAARTVRCLAEAVEPLPEPVLGAVRHQLGLDREGRAGKALRPALALLCADGCGDLDAGLPAAVAVELVHNASLLHDDIIDRDETRRHRPAAWRACGVGTAVLAGDAMTALALETLARVPRRADLALACLARTLHDLVAGQVLDVAFETRQHVPTDHYTAMATGKTAVLMQAACELGALLAGAGAGQLEALGGFGRHLGIAFQILDDYHGIWSSCADTGKPAASDLRSRKKTFPVTVALAEATAPARRLRALYRQPADLTPEQTQLAVQLISQTTAREATRRAVAHARATAVQRLNLSNANPRARRNLLDLADHILADPALRTGTGDGRAAAPGSGPPGAMAAESTPCHADPQKKTQE
ncbi:polyprenyl synthetase family protein [Amycolatopsis rubida]|uniref:Geranylgeranyl diphosphate synthase, type I n=1 Tax=Amycolatopsis rubida TaxID=112413 RepID=A0A1I5VL65_9PSEU|nr:MULTISPECIES: polyprenyl synthetase family protein [Amycolatopsis]MYW93781.1 polyprenyl synthetase family protein [Amycolatopsis rubida]NEC58770.1 polyprenyl synthetase family protein [Amycolatopsis rubida]OAP22968.1 (2E,6E)-farnesyl diphosphate synthase [Amycolatopsis sp. M39]SFQ08112.1 geranylgeranyl diphosphate synthase, type I [Amycolatopsis rubida]